MKAALHMTCQETHSYSDKGKRCYSSHDWEAKGRTNAIGAFLIGSTLIANGFDLWFTQYGCFYVLGRADVVAKPSKSKSSCYR